jgi:hypothetical protein
LLRELRERSYTGGYTLLTDWLRPQREAARTVAVRRFETPPGKQAQVDWGHLGTVEMNGEERKLWASPSLWIPNIPSRLKMQGLKGRRVTMLNVGRLTVIRLVVVS